MWGGGGRPMNRNTGLGPSPGFCLVWFQHRLQIFYEGLGKDSKMAQIGSRCGSMCGDESGGEEKPGSAVGRN